MTIWLCLLALLTELSGCQSSPVQPVLPLQPPAPEITTIEAYRADLARTCELEVAANFPVYYVRHRPTVTVLIQGQGERMQVDSGASLSFLTAEAFDELPERAYLILRKPAPVASIGGTASLVNLTLQDISFGTILLRGQVMGIDDSETLFINGQPEFDGVLGENVLRHFDIGFDLPDDLITFYAQQNCKTPALPWAAGEDPIPLVISKFGLPILSTTIDNRNFSMVLDSGTSQTIVSQASLDLARVKPEFSPPSAQQYANGFTGKIFALHQEQFLNVTIGDTALSNDCLWVYSGTGSFPQGDGVLGDDHLATHRIYVDNATKTVYISKANQSN